MRMMTGIGTPRSQSKIPRPIAASIAGWHTTISACAGTIGKEFFSFAPRAPGADQPSQRGSRAQSETASCRASYRLRLLFMSSTLATNRIDQDPRKAAAGVLR